MMSTARPPSSPVSEESWTVDCPCGVDFDDGEEMVNCDECGVWVHTSCCQFVKGHTSYVCDKCKSQKKERKDLEEMEVAQLLVKLPDSTASPDVRKMTAEKADYGSLRSELLSEEKSHIQGIPGGDPSFFIGVSPVFSRQLWKFTGYVPKVSHFLYKELPELSEIDVTKCILWGKSADEQLENCRSEEAGILGQVDRHQTEEGQWDHINSPQTKSHGKTEAGKDVKPRHAMQEEVKCQPLGKRRRDDSRKKDWIGRKHVKNVEC